MAELAVVDRTHEVTAFGDACRWTGVLSSDRETWLDARTRYLTASDMAAVLGEDGKRSALQVYLEKKGEIEGLDASSIKHPAFWGSALERPILDIAADFYGWEVTLPGGALLESRAFPWMAATLDAELRVDGEQGQYEGKTTGYWLHRDWDEEAQKPPRRVLVQVQHQLVVTGAPFAMVFCLIGGNTPVKIRIEPHRPFQDLLVIAARDFMKAVHDGTPPAAGYQDDEVLQRRYPREQHGGIVRLPEEAAQWSAEILRLAEEQKRLERQEKALRNRVKQLIGDATWGVTLCEDGSPLWWRWLLQERAEHVVKASASRVLMRIKKQVPRIHPDQLRLLEVARPKELLDDLQASLDDVSARRVEIESPSARR